MRSIGDPSGFVEQPIKLRLDPVNGNQLEREWQGRWDALINQLILGNLAVGGRTAEYTQEGSKATVRVQYGGAAVAGGTEQAQVTFSMRTNTNTASIFKNERFSGLNSAIVKTILDEFQKQSSGNQDKPGDMKGSYATVYNFAFAQTGGNTVAADTALDAFRLLIAGDDNFLVSNTYTLTMVRTSSYGFNLPVVFADDGKIFSSTGLSNYIASALPFSAPVLSAIPVAGEQLLLVYGWRKTGSEWFNLPNANVQLTESWESSRYSLLLYRISSWG